MMEMIRYLYLTEVKIFSKDSKTTNKEKYKFFMNLETQKNYLKEKQKVFGIDEYQSYYFYWDGDVIESRELLKQRKVIFSITYGQFNKKERNIYSLYIYKIPIHDIPIQKKSLLENNIVYLLESIQYPNEYFYVFISPYEQVEWLKDIVVTDELSEQEKKKIIDMEYNNSKDEYGSVNIDTKYGTFIISGYEVVLG